MRRNEQRPKDWRMEEMEDSRKLGAGGRAALSA